MTQGPIGTQRTFLVNSTMQGLRLAIPKLCKKHTSTKVLHLGNKFGRHSDHCQIDSHHRLVVQTMRLVKLIQRLHLTVLKWYKKCSLKKLLRLGKQPGRQRHSQIISNPEEGLYTPRQRVLRNLSSPMPKKLTIYSCLVRGPLTLYLGWPK